MSVQKQKKKKKESVFLNGLVNVKSIEEMQKADLVYIEKLCLVKDATQWEIGDVILQRFEKHQGKESELKEYCETRPHMNYKTILAFRRVSEAFSFSRRLEKLLSWEHHHICAGQGKKRFEWLQKAEKNCWSTRELREEIKKTEGGFEYEFYNVWNFGECDKRFGIQEFKGRIPGQIVQNVLYYFTEEGDFVVDPMAGGGTTIDVCKLMERHIIAYDINPLRDDILKHDILEGFPKECDGCDLIFLDPPYFNMVFDMFQDIKEFYAFIETLASTCYETVKDGGIVAFLMQDMTEKGNYCLTGECYRIFRRIGFEAVSHISCPLSTEQFLPQQVNKAKETKHLLGRNRDLYIFKKV